MRQPRRPARRRWTTTRYWSARAGGEVHPDVAWSYPDPVVACPRIAGLVAFVNERVDLVIDGAPQRRPHTPWSTPALALSRRPAPGTGCG